uniref:Uncharacterized protein n=1 Tax=Salix viminalis TaxID=40686 RepID=A0A6N2K236_SALVM
MERDEEIQAYLGNKFLTCVEVCQESFVIAFSIIILVDETGKVYQLVYISERTALVEGGEGFQRSTDFLSRMLSENRLSETDGALGLVHLSHAKQTDFGEQRASRSARRMLPLSLKNACKNRYLLRTFL